MKQQRATAKAKAKVINIFTQAQVQAIIDGVHESAFQIELNNDDDGPQAILKSGSKDVFRVDFTKRVLYRYRHGNAEVAYIFTEKPWYRFNTVDETLWSNLEGNIRAQGELGLEVFSDNLFRREEIEIIIEAIRGMVFKISRPLDFGDVEILSFEEREVMRFNTRTKVFSMVGTSGQPQDVYTFKPEPDHWFWASTDRDLLKRLEQALAFYRQTMHRVRMADFRMLFGRTIQEVIGKLAQLMDEAEAENNMLMRIDSTGGGASLHPEVARLVQKDLDAGAEAAEEQGDR